MPDDNLTEPQRSDGWHDPLDDLIAPILNQHGPAKSSEYPMRPAAAQPVRRNPLDDLLPEVEQSPLEAKTKKILDHKFDKVRRDFNARELEEEASRPSGAVQKTQAAEAVHWPYDQAGRAVDPKNLLPIGGWLNLVAAGLVFGAVVGPIRLYLDISLAMVAKLEDEYPGFNELLIGEAIIRGAMLVSQVALAVLFFRRHWTVPRLMVLLLSLNVLASVVMLVWSKQVFGEWLDPANSLTGPLVVATIWIPYFLLSKRVKLTFGCQASTRDGSRAFNYANSTDDDEHVSHLSSLQSSGDQKSGRLGWKIGFLVGVLFLGGLAAGVMIGQNFGTQNVELAGHAPSDKGLVKQSSTNSERDEIPQSDSRSIAPYGTWPPSAEKPSQDSLTSAVNRQVDRLQKDSNVQLRPDRAKRATAFSFYQIGIETARRAYDLSSSLDGLESDRLSKTAIEHFNRAVEVDPTFSAPIIALACIELYDRGAHDRARQMLNQVINREPANAEAHYYLADVYYDDGDEVQALLSIERALNFDPNFAPAYALRAVIHQHRGEFSKAKADQQVFANLGGSVDRNSEGGTYPWTIRSILFESKKTGLSLRYSSIWYPFDSVAKGTELRLIRNSDRKNVAISFINLADDVTADGGPLDLLNHVVKEIEDEQRNLSADSDFSASRASMVQIGDHRVAWTDMKTTKPAALSQRSRVFLLKRREQAWLIRFSVPAGNESFFQQHLPSAEDVIRSVSFRTMM